MDSIVSCFSYALVVLLLTTIWIYVGRSWSFATLANAMYFPFFASLLFIDNAEEYIGRTLGFSTIKDSIIFSALSAFIVLNLVGAVAVLDVIAGWAVTSPSPKESAVHEHNHSSIGGLLRAAGEEIGWRSFLLPCLMAHFTPGVALLINGVCWGLFHVPVMVLLTKILNVPHPTLTICVQCLSCVLSAFPHGWVAIKSGYSLWASTVMHFVWNKINPIILGSIYTQKPGVLQGKQWLINGEGLAGCIILLPVAFIVVNSL